MKLDETNFNARLALYAQQVDYEWDWAGVEKVGPPHPWYHGYLTASGQLDMALQHPQRFLSEMPATAKAYVQMGQAYYLKRQYDQAAGQYLRALELEPTASWAHEGLGLTFLQQRKFGPAIKELEKAVQPSGGPTRMLATLA